MYFDFDYYKDKKVAIHCKNKTQAKKWCNLMHKNGFKWRTGMSYKSTTYYDTVKDQTCYDLVGMHSDISYYESENYDIADGKIGLRC